MDDAARRWADELSGWGIPEPIIEAAPQSPYGFPTDLFASAADEAMEQRTPTTRAVRETLPTGGSILDVGCGGGAASLPVADAAGHLVGVDESEDLLEEFAVRGRRLGVTVERVHGRWPDVAAATPTADVAVCRNVAYNVPDLDEVVTALTSHARRRVVLELTCEHPLAWLRPYWRELHGVEFPDGPVLDDAVAVVRGTGVEPEVVTWEGRLLFVDTTEEEVRGLLQRRLCLTDDRLPELDAAIGRHGIPETRPTATLWWAGVG